MWWRQKQVFGMFGGGATLAQRFAAVGAAGPTAEAWLCDRGETLVGTDVASHEGILQGFVMTFATGARPVRNATGWHTGKPTFTFSGALPQNGICTEAALLPGAGGNACVWVCYKRNSIATSGLIAGYYNASYKTMCCVGITAVPDREEGWLSETGGLGCGKKDLLYSCMVGLRHGAHGEVWLNGLERKFSDSQVSTFVPDRIQVGGAYGGTYFVGEIAAYGVCDSTTVDVEGLTNLLVSLGYGPDVDILEPAENNTIWFASDLHIGSATSGIVYQGVVALGSLASTWEYAGTNHAGVVLGGDVMDSAADAAARYAALRSTLANVADFDWGDGPKALAVVGNHDDTSAARVSALTGQYSVVPAGEHYFETPVTQHVRFVALDSLDGAPNGQTAAQNAWLDATLAAATEPWIIPVQHYAPQVADTLVLRTPVLQWEALFEQYGIRLVLQGHRHVNTATYPLTLSDRDDALGVVHCTIGPCGGSLICRPGVVAEDIVDTNRTDTWDSATGAELSQLQSMGSFARIEADATTLRLRLYDIAAKIDGVYRVRTIYDKTLTVRP